MDINKVILTLKNMGKGDGKGDGTGEGAGTGAGYGTGEGAGTGTGKGSGKNDEGVGGCMGFGICCCITIVVLVVIALGGLGIAKIVMGAVYIDDCPLEKKVPIYLIVAGCVPILMSGLSSFKKKGDEDATEEEKAKCSPFGIIGLIGTLFNFAWLICGSVWVFGNYSDVMDSCPGQTDCCDRTLMKFALAVTIIDWIFFGLIIVVVCCSMGIACCAMCCMKKDEVV